MCLFCVSVYRGEIRETRYVTSVKPITSRLCLICAHTNARPVTREASWSRCAVPPEADVFSRVPSASSQAFSNQNPAAAGRTTGFPLPRRPEFCRRLPSPLPPFPPNRPALPAVPPPSSRPARSPHAGADQPAAPPARWVAFTPGGRRPHTPNSPPAPGRAGPLEGDRPRASERGGGGGEGGAWQPPPARGGGGRCRAGQSLPPTPGPLSEPPARLCCQRGAARPHAGAGVGGGGPAAPRGPP